MGITRIHVSGFTAQVMSREPLVSGTVGMPVEFTFGEDWQALKKTAVFRCDGITYTVLELKETAAIPWELLRKPGCTLKAGVYGTSEDGSVQTPTLWAELGKIQEGADPAGGESAEPTLPLWQQLSENKLDKPGTAPQAGAVLKIKSVDDDGTFTSEWGMISVQNEPIHITLEEAVSQVNVDTSDFTVPINKCSKITVIFSLPATGTEYKFNSNIKFASSRNKKDVDVLIANASYGVTTVAANLSANVFVTIENKDGFMSSVMRYSHKSSNLVQATYSNCCHENLNEKLSGENADSIIFTMSGAPAGTIISIYSESEGGFEA